MHIVRFYPMVRGFLFFIFLSANYGCVTPDEASVEIASNIPSLDGISGKWVGADTTAMEPSIRNFRGQALLNRDMTSISWFASAPYSGGYHTGTMKINGQIPMVSEFRWLPYEGLRKSTLDDWELLSSTRMLPDENGIMWRIEITNTSSQPKNLNIDLDMIGFNSKYEEDDWQWWYPYPKMDGKTTDRDTEVEIIRKSIGQNNDRQNISVEKLLDGKPTAEDTRAQVPTDDEILHSNKYASALENGSLIISDQETDAITGFGLKSKPDHLVQLNSGGTANWEMEVAPGETKTVEYFMTYGDNKEIIQKNLDLWKTDFDTKFSQVKEVWESRWQDMFTPNNSLISGCFPVLETADTLASRVYYTGPLTLLYLTNTNLPQHDKVFLTGGPRWGASTTFFWDITEWSGLFAVVDPDMMREQIISWIKIDPSKYYGVDNFGGEGVGNAYSANYWALFQLIRSYITTTQDFDILNEQVNGKTVLETLAFYATNWERISSYGSPGCTDEIYKLADFGADEWNLLECVPTYKHIVPSFNAGYIWMMRETAAFYKQLGFPEEADTFNKKADMLLPLLMQLYKGDGVWNSLYPDNKTVEVRHCLDFMFMGRYLADDLTPTIKTEMLGFLDQELLTDHWMRAQSLKDVAAKNSDRPDHGPLGAFDGWPAGTMDALTQMGFAQKALDFYRAIEPVTREGVWAQAHELWGPDKYNKQAQVRIAERGWHNRESSAGIGLSQVMLKSFFGFNPTVDGTPLESSSMPDFQGTLHHVLYGGEYYTITLENGKRVFTKETE